VLIQIFLIIVGFILLIKGADFLVDGASNFAKKVKIPEIVIGLTIVSIGTSMPELFVSITSALKGYSDLSVGNVIGSNIANLLLILGTSALLKPVLFQKETIKYEIPICLGATVLFGILANSNNTITRIEAIVLLVAFIMFIFYTIILAKSKREKQKVVKSKTTYLFDILMMILGIAGLKFGGDLTVNNAVKIAEALNVSEKIISITILAVGTSLPELVTSVRAAIKGESDIAVGNIIGSNIFNILLIIGTSAVIKPIMYNISYNRDLIIFFISLILLLIFAYTKPKKKLSRFNGLIFVLGYIVYIIMLFVI